MDQSNRYADWTLREEDLMAGGSYGHIDGPAARATSLRQAEQCWRTGADPIAFAQDNREFTQAFESFPSDADQLYPGWRNSLNVAA